MLCANYITKVPYQYYNFDNNNNQQQEFYLNLHCWLPTLFEKFIGST